MLQEPAILEQRLLLAAPVATSSQGSTDSAAGGDGASADSGSAMSESTATFSLSGDVVQNFALSSSVSDFSEHRHLGADTDTQFALDSLVPAGAKPGPSRFLNSTYLFRGPRHLVGPGVHTRNLVSSHDPSVIAKPPPLPAPDLVEVDLKILPELSPSPLPSLSMPAFSTELAPEAAAVAETIPPAGEAFLVTSAESNSSVFTTGAESSVNHHPNATALQPVAQAVIGRNTSLQTDVGAAVRRIASPGLTAGEAEPQREQSDFLLHMLTSSAATLSSPLDRQLELLNSVRTSESAAAGTDLSRYQRFADILFSDAAFDPAVDSDHQDDQEATLISLQVQHDEAVVPIQPGEAEPVRLKQTRHEHPEHSGDLSPVLTSEHAVLSASGTGCGDRPPAEWQQSACERGPRGPPGKQTASVLTSGRTDFADLQLMRLRYSIAPRGPSILPSFEMEESNTSTAGLPDQGGHQS